MHGRNGIKFHEYRVSIISSTRDLFDRSTYRRRGSTCFPFSPLFFLFVTWDNIFSSFFFPSKINSAWTNVLISRQCRTKEGFWSRVNPRPNEDHASSFRTFSLFFPPLPFPSPPSFFAQLIYRERMFIKV